MIEDPLSTLLARVAGGDDGAAAVSALVPDAPVPLATDLVVWLGDVVAGPAEAVAVAVVRVPDGPGGVASVLAAAATDDALAGRLGREVATLASAHLCETVRAEEGGPGEPGPVAVLARSGLTGAGPTGWSVE